MLGQPEEPQLTVSQLAVQPQLANVYVCLVRVAEITCSLLQNDV